MIARADSHAPALKKSTELLDAGRFDDAVAELQSIVTDMPEHERASAALGHARALAEAQRQRQLRVKLEQDARTALDDREYARCLRILDEATKVLHADEAAALAPLRERAEAGGAAQEAIRRAERRAGEAIERTMKARSMAEAVEAERYAPTVWKEAEAQWTNARAGFVRGEYAEAELALDAAAGTYERAARATREAQVPEREVANRVREARAAAAAEPEAQHIGGGLAPDAGDQTVLSNERAPFEPTTGDATLGSRRFWSEDAVPRPSPSRRRLFLAVALVAGIAVVALISLLLPTRTASVAQRGRDVIEGPVARQEPPPPAAAGTEPTEQKAERLAPAASATPSEPTLPAVPRREVKAAEPPRVAAIQRQSSEVEQAQARMSKARRAAEQTGANYYAHKLFASAQAKEREGAAALGKSDQGSALQMFAEAESAYVAAAEAARREAETERQLAPVKAALDDAQAKASTSRKQALTAEADWVVKDLFYAAQARHVEADDLVSRQNLAAATQAYLDAADRYAAAARRAEGIHRIK